MNVSKVLVSAAAVASVVGAIGFSYAENINYRSPNNTTQTQSDAALPCQPGPFNPHLPVDARTGASGTTTDCATSTTVRVQVQADAAAPNQPAAFNPPAQDPQPSVASSVTISEPSSAYRTASNDRNTMADERDPRADRN